MIRSSARRGGGAPMAGHRRGLLAVLDQGASSASNFLVLITAARALSTGEFGLFALSFAVVTFGLALGRAVVAVPLSIDLRLTDARSQPELVGRSTAASAMIGLLFAGISLILGLVLGRSNPVLLTLLVLLALGVPFVLMQDLWRYLATARGRPGDALKADLGWLVVASAALGCTFIPAASRFAWLGVTGWVLGAVLSWAWFVAHADYRCLERTGVLSWLRSDPRRRELALDALTAQSVPVLAGMLMAAVGADLLGAVRGAGTLMSPVNVLLMAAPLVLLAPASRRSPREGAAMIAVASAALLAFAVLWGTTLMILPNATGRAILGVTWQSSAPIIPWTTLEFMGVAVWTGVVTYLRAQNATRRALHLRYVYAVCGLAGVAAVTVMAPTPAHIAAAQALAAVLIAVLGVAVVCRQIRDRQATPEPRKETLEADKGCR